MPIYEYECSKCGDRLEIMQKVSESPKRKCPSCGRAGLRKLISAAAFQLKGTGWYVTDFRDQGKKKDEKKKDGEDRAASEKSEKSDKSESSAPAAGKDDKKSSKRDAAAA